MYIHTHIREWIIREVATGVLDLPAFHHPHPICRRELARKTYDAVAGRDDVTSVGEDLQGDLAFVGREEVADKGHGAHLRMYIYIHMYIHEYVGVIGTKYIYVYTYTFVHTHTHTQKKHTHTHTHHTHTSHTHTHIHTDTHKYTHAHINMVRT